MTSTLLLWFALSLVCDVAGQLCFKVGVDRLPQGGGGVALLAMPLREPWLLYGIVIYVVEIFVWLRILAEVPLSLAFPVASLNFLGVTLASWALLGERVEVRQWVGATLITVGVVVVARTA